MEREKFSLLIDRDEKLYLRGEVNFPPGLDRIPLVIIVPGFLGFKDWGFYPVVSKALVDAGFAVARINHSTGGIGESGEVYSDLESLSKMHVRWDLLDIEVLISSIRKHKISSSDRVDLERIGMVGHSKGGGISILYAAKDPVVRAIVTINGVSEFLRIPHEKVREIIKNGVFEKVLPGTMINMKFKVDFWKEILESPEEYDIKEALKRTEASVLFLQSENDEIVTIDEAKVLFDSATGNKNLKFLPGADHNLGCKVLCSEITTGLENVCNEVVNWMNENLKRG